MVDEEEEDCQMLKSITTLPNLEPVRRGNTTPGFNANNKFSFGGNDF
jgi:hypothetical protein